MATLAEALLEHGIRPKSYREGNQKLVCPKCSHQRRNRKDPCLSLTISHDGAVWNCHHCDWSGHVRYNWREHDKPARPRISVPVRPKSSPGELTATALRWLADRGISETVARRNRLGSARVWVPALQAESDCICFPYFGGGVLVNIKFRALASKAFTQVKDAEAILYGLDDIADADTAIFVEGEPDKLAAETAGFTNVVSVPNGAHASEDDDAPAFAYLANSADQLDHIKRIVLALDADEKGKALEAELARRLGKERCWRARWPDSNDVQCKDANETLITHGVEALRECIDVAEPYPITGLRDVLDYAEDTIALYRAGRTRGHLTGWTSVDELMTIRPGELSIITGIPSSGKSEFLDALMVNIARRYGWRFAICRFENPPTEHIAKISEKYLGMPFWDGPSWRMSESDLGRAMDWAQNYFTLLRADDDAPTVEWILEKARAAVLRHGIRGLVVDPYNDIEHRRPANMTETEYVSQLLGAFRRFAQTYGVHVWIVAHPAKMQRENGHFPVPTLYDISGSANWANKADLGVVVHRPDPIGDPTAVEIYVRKVRFKSVGKIGAVRLSYDKTTGRYSERASVNDYTDHSDRQA
jgi:twinkle protein